MTFCIIIPADGTLKPVDCACIPSVAGIVIMVVRVNMYVDVVYIYVWTNNGTVAVIAWVVPPIIR